MTTTTAVSADRKAVLQRRTRWVVAVTIGYNPVEGVVSVAAGSAASSTALIGFGLDSFIEVLSAASAARQFTRKNPERYERRVIAVAFFLLAAYVTTSAVLSVTGVPNSEQSTIGVIVIVMSVRPLIERRAGRELGSATAVGEQGEHVDAVCVVLEAGRSRARPVRRPHVGFVHDEGEPCRLAVLMNVGVVDIAVEHPAVAEAQRRRLARHLDANTTVADVCDLSGSACVSFAVVPISGSQRPIPQFDDVGRIRSGQQHSLAAVAAFPERGNARARDRRARGGVGGRHQGRYSDAERIAQTKQCSDARVDGPLLDADYHAPAHTGDLRELVESPSHRDALLAHTTSYGRINPFARLRHNSAGYCTLGYRRPYVHVDLHVRG